MSIDLSEWLAELEKITAGPAATDAKTVTEISAESGRSDESVRKAVKAALAHDKMELVMVRRLRMDGIMTRVPAYRWKKKKK